MRQVCLKYTRPYIQKRQSTNAQCSSSSSFTPSWLKQVLSRFAPSSLALALTFSVKTRQSILVVSKSNIEGVIGGGIEAAPDETLAEAPAPPLLQYKYHIPFYS